MTPGAPLRVVGVGSPFGADRVGWELVAALERRRPSPRIDYLAADRPGAALLAAIEGAERVVIIDAMRAGLEPGTVHTLDRDQLELGGGLLSSHGFGVAEALDLGAALGLLPPRVLVVGIEIGPPPSPALSGERFAGVLDEVVAVVAAETRLLP